MATHDFRTSHRSYPVRVTAELDPHLSRGLWIIKWLLAIPHYFVLVFLWIAFAVSSVIAFFAILFTGRFPRPMFDFNVGVMRWTWRVAYYAYGVLGTDRYPPFTLAEVPDYPAHLEVDYPQRLSRGLVLVKWWLLALPHYFVVAFFVGGGIFAADQASDDFPAFVLGGGLVGLLVLIAAIVLLFTGRYPRSLFDLVLGLQRWVLRVAAYAALMTDEYPPFRLDMGGTEDSPTSTSHEQSPGDPAGSGPQPDRSTARTASLVGGIVLLVMAAGALLGAGALWSAKATLPDDEGFFTTPTLSCDVSSAAITSESIRLDLPGWAGLTPASLLGDGRVTVESRAGDPVFVGLARTADVDTYLAGVRHSTVDTDDGDTRCSDSGGASSPAPPATMTWWLQQSEGPGSQNISWAFEEGDWTLVVMNPDGSAGLNVDMEAAATLPGIKILIAGFLIAAGVLTLIGTALVIGSRSTTRRP